MKKERLKQISISISETEEKNLKKMAVKEGKSLSELGRIYLQQGLGIESNKENLDLIINTINRAIDDKLDNFFVRLFRILAKICKATWTTTLLVVNLIVRFFDKKAEFIIKDEIKKAEQKAYLILKQGYLEVDIDKLFPKNIYDKEDDQDE